MTGSGSWASKGFFLYKTRLVIRGKTSKLPGEGEGVGATSAICQGRHQGNLPGREGAIVAGMGGDEDVRDQWGRKRGVAAHVPCCAARKDMMLAPPHTLMMTASLV